METRVVSGLVESMSEKMLNERIVCVMIKWVE